MAITVLNDSPDLMSLLPVMPNPTQTWHCFTSPEAACDNLANMPHAWEDTYSSTEADKVGFTGTDSLQHAFKLCRDGWQDGSERVARLRDKINAQNPIGPRLVKYDVAGAYPIVARHLAGNPLSMRRFDSARLRRKPVLTLINHMGGRFSVPAECFINKCAVVAAIVDAIESAGYSCHVIGISQSATEATYSDYLCGVAITIKQPGEQVDISRMAFALGHVGMFRRIVFGTRSTLQANRPLGPGLGSTIDFVPGTLPEATYALPSMNTNHKLFTTEDKAGTEGLAKLISELAAQGCPAFPQTAQAA